MIPIKIIKHQEAEPVSESGDILLPFTTWSETLTGDGWFSRVHDEYYDKKLYYPLTAVHQNSWAALNHLGVDCDELMNRVKYKCPYNGYIHFWCVPVLVFAKDVKNWTTRHKVTKEDMYLDEEWMRKFFPPKIKNALPFTKVQRALLGPGYTDMAIVSDGNGYLYDALVALDNEDYLGVKVWMWFNK